MLHPYHHLSGCKYTTSFPISQTFLPNFGAHAGRNGVRHLCAPLERGGKFPPILWAQTEKTSLFNIF